MKVFMTFYDSEKLKLASTSVVVAVEAWMEVQLVSGRQFFHLELGKSSFGFGYYWLYIAQHLFDYHANNSDYFL